MGQLSRRKRATAVKARNGKSGLKYVQMLWAVKEKREITAMFEARERLDQLNMSEWLIERDGGYMYKWVSKCACELESSYVRVSVYVSVCVS